MEEKTIVGIASAAGGGIGIIRVSGSESTTRATPGIRAL